MKKWNLIVPGLMIIGVMSLSSSCIVHEHRPVRTVVVAPARPVHVVRVRPVRPVKVVKVKPAKVMVVKPGRGHGRYK